MVFSSLPLFLDHPFSLQHPDQHRQLQGQNNHHDQNHHHLIPPLHQTPRPEPPLREGIGGGGLGAQRSRPNSMAERSRQRQIQPPETPLKCPRCASANTKFCYYNNYNLSQPRHMCKSCRRYWTHGGALRNVPVGGCRKNKRSASSSKPSSKPLTMVNRNLNPNFNPNPSLGGNSRTPMSFLTSMENTGPQFGGMTSMGLAYSSGPIHTPLASITNPPEGITGGLERGGHLHLEFPPHVRFPNFLGGFEIPSSFQNVDDNNQGNGDGYEDNGNTEDQQQMRNDMSKSSCMGMVSEVKMEKKEMTIMGISSSTNTNTDKNNQFINWDGDNNGTNSYYHVD